MKRQYTVRFELKISQSKSNVSDVDSKESVRTNGETTKESERSEKDETDEDEESDEEESDVSKSSEEDDDETEDLKGNLCNYYTNKTKKFACGGL